MYAPGVLMSVQNHFATNDAWLTICHGDPRIDNWFFDEKDGAGAVVNEIGLLDWQLMFKGGSATDISWYFSTTIDADDPSSEGLVEIYYHALAKEEFKPSLEEFKEELALAHIISYAKAIISTWIAIPWR